jgi:hypothetical protein
MTTVDPFSPFVSTDDKPWSPIQGPDRWQELERRLAQIPVYLVDHALIDA